MATKTRQRLAWAVWRLARAQHGVVARWQLLELGATEGWIKHRLEKAGCTLCFEASTPSADPS